jgi:hypothetical protein
MSVQLFNAPLTAAYRPTQPLLVSCDRAVFDLLLTVGVPGAITCYVETVDGNPFSPSTVWSREVIEDTSPGNGNINMIKVVRSVLENGGGNLGVGTHKVGLAFLRSCQLARLQLAATGTVSVIVTAPFGTIPAQA